MSPEHLGKYYLLSVPIFYMQSLRLLSAQCKAYICILSFFLSLPLTRLILLEWKLWKDNHEKKLTVLYWGWRRRQGVNLFSNYFYDMSFLSSYFSNISQILIFNWIFKLTNRNSIFNSCSHKNKTNWYLQKYLPKTESHFDFVCKISYE